MKRIMYVEYKGGELDGPGRIAWVELSRSRRAYHYRGRLLHKVAGYKYNCVDAETGDIEDVPFDVRHLRVVVFDVREPGWSDKLRRDITTYLKNTRSEPEKSIPQPYREFPLDEPDGQPIDQATPVRKSRK